MTSRKLLLLVTLTVVVFVALAGYGDFRTVGSRLASFPPHYLSAALALAVLNYSLRFLRWSYYLDLLRIEVPFRLSLLVFLSGLALSITPGKVGELVKGYFLRNRAGVPLTASIPAILMERLTDVIAVGLLGLIGLTLLPASIRWILLVVLIFSGVFVYLLASHRSQMLFSLPLLRRWREDVEHSREGLRRLTAPKPMLVAVGLGVVAWLSEGLALWIIIKGLGEDLSLVWTLPVYASATIAGSLSTLPGGLIATEGAMLALLQQSGVARGAAAAGTLLVRLVTLWFAVAIGLGALAVLNRFQPVGVEEA